MTDSGVRLLHHAQFFMKKEEYKKNIESTVLEITGIWNKDIRDTIDKFVEDITKLKEYYSNLPKTSHTSSKANIYKYKSPTQPKPKL